MRTVYRMITGSVTATPMKITTSLFALLLACAGTVFAFDLQGHRGARGLRPENTLPAFAHALDLGVTTLELDIGVSADGRVVIAHDPFLNPLITRDASGQWLPGPRGPLIRSLSFAQLQAYDVGRIQPGTAYAKTFETQQAVDRTRIPALSQLFDLVKARGADAVRFNIETKLSPHQPDETVGPDAMVQALLATIREAGMLERVSVQSFDWRTLRLVQQLEPRIPTVYLTVQSATSDNARDPAWTAGLQLSAFGGVPRMVKAAGGSTWSPNAPALTQSQVREAQALGLKVIPWTVNDPAAMERLIGWGVDGLITDYPDRLRAVLARRGMQLP
jgi:glycerophosphoryl diester phosphodiesterase